jgi:hypothetical protein
MDRLQNIYDGLRDKNEIAIYDKYGKIAKRITIMFISKNKIFLILMWLLLYFDITIKRIIIYKTSVILLYCSCIKCYCSKRENL